MDQQINQQNKAFIETPALCSYTYEIQLFPLFISKLSPMTATPSPLEIWTERQIKHAYLIGGEQDCIHLLNESMSTEEIWLRERGWGLWPAEFGKKKENSSLFQHGSLGATLAGLPLPPLCSADYIHSAFLGVWTACFHSNRKKQTVRRRLPCHAPLLPLEPSNSILEQALRCQVSTSAQVRP